VDKTHPRRHREGRKEGQAGAWAIRVENYGQVIITLFSSFSGGKEEERRGGEEEKEKDADFPFGCPHGWARRGTGE